MYISAMIIALVMPISQTAPNANKSGDELDAPYTDASFGFSIRPPKGWSFSAARKSDGQSVTILTMAQAVGPMESGEISLKFKTTRGPVVIGDELKAATRFLDLEFKNVHIEAQQEQRIGDHPGAYITATYMRSGEIAGGANSSGGKPKDPILYRSKDIEIIHFQALIQVASNEYFNLSFTGPVAIRAKAEPLFQRVLSSFSPLKDRLDSVSLGAARELGLKWLETLDAGAVKRAAAESQLLKFQLDGKDVGFVEVQSTPEEWKKHPGVQIYERGWLFEPEGVAKRTQNAMFLSDDLQYERWRTSVTTWVAAKGDQPDRLDNSYEEGLRDHDALLSNQAASLTEPEVQNPPLKLPKGYISRVLARCFPRLAGDLATPRIYSFATFDRNVVGMIAKVLELKGETTSPNGDGKKVYRIDEREGLAATPSELYLDKDGRIVFVKSGRLTMQPAAAKEIERIFADRVQNAENVMQRLEGQYRESEKRFGGKSSRKTAPAK